MPTTHEHAGAASDLAVATPEMQAKLDWMGEQPGLAEFRDRAAVADLGEVQNNFERCG